MDLKKLNYSLIGVLISIPCLAEIRNAHAALNATQGKVRRPASADPYAQKMDDAFSLLQKKEYSQAIKEFDNIYWNSKTFFNDALFYIIICQDKLDLIAQAQGNIANLNMNTLPEAKKSLILKIKEKTPPAVTPAPDSLKSNFFGITLNGGGAAYTAASANQGGNFYGIALSWAGFVDKITLTYDKLNLFQSSSQVTSPSSFSQNQYFVSYGRGLGEHFSAKSSFTILSNSDTSTNGGGAVGGLIKYFNGNSFYIGPEIYYSFYPNYVYNYLLTTSQPMNALEYSLDTGFLISSNQDSALYMDLKGMLINPTDKDDTSNVSFNQNYFSLDMNLRYYIGPSTITLGGWVGKQLFAVQGEGHDLYNIGNARVWKVSTSYSYSFLSGITFTLFAGLEGINEIGATISRPTASDSNPTSTQLFSGGSALNISF